MATTWTGEASLRSKIENMVPAARKALSEGVSENAKEMAAMAKRLAPVRDGADGGALRDSIRAYWSGTAPPPAGADVDIAKSQSRIAVKGEYELAMTVAAGSDIAYYARWMEFGSSQQSASPFFFVAYRALRRKFRRRMGQKVRQAALAQRRG